MERALDLEHGQEVDGYCACGRSSTVALPSQTSCMSTSVKSRAVSSRIASPEPSVAGITLGLMFVPNDSSLSAATEDGCCLYAIVAVRRSMPLRMTRPTSRSPSGASVTVPAFFGWPNSSRPAAIAASDSSTNIGE